MQFPNFQLVQAKETINVVVEKSFTSMRFSQTTTLSKSSFINFLFQSKVCQALSGPIGRPLSKAPNHEDQAGQQKPSKCHLNLVQFSYSNWVRLLSAQSNVNQTWLTTKLSNNNKSRIGGRSPVVNETRNDHMTSATVVSAETEHIRQWNNRKVQNPDHSIEMNDWLTEGDRRHLWHIVWSTVGCRGLAVSRTK